MSTEPNITFLKTRRSKRRPVALRIRVFGTSLRGRDFAEDCVCLRTSRHGAQIRLKHLLITDDTVRILVPATNKEASFRVVGQLPDQPDAPYADWGVEALNTNENIWPK